MLNIRTSKGIYHIISANLHQGTKGWELWVERVNCTNMKLSTSELGDDEKFMYDAIIYAVDNGVNLLELDV